MWCKGKPEQGYFGLCLSQTCSWRPKSKKKKNPKIKIRQNMMVLFSNLKNVLYVIHTNSYLRCVSLKIHQNCTTLCLIYGAIYISPRNKSWEVCHCVKGAITLKMKTVSNSENQKPHFHMFIFPFSCYSYEIVHWIQQNYLQTTLLFWFRKKIIYLQLGFFPVLGNFGISSEYFHAWEKQHLMITSDMQIIAC